MTHEAHHHCVCEQVRNKVSAILLSLRFNSLALIFLIIHCYLINLRINWK